MMDLLDSRILLVEDGASDDHAAHVGAAVAAYLSPPSCNCTLAAFYIL